MQPLRFLFFRGLEEFDQYRDNVHLWRHNGPLCMLKWGFGIDAATPTYPNLRFLIRRKLPLHIQKSENGLKVVKEVGCSYPSYYVENICLAYEKYVRFEVAVV